jgi:PAT family beta-lactamase induction signal transducer AmpG
MMSASYQLGYRLALLCAGAGALYIADFASWRAAYLAMAGLMLVGIVACLLSPPLDRPREAKGSRALLSPAHLSSRSAIFSAATAPR